MIPLNRPSPEELIVAIPVERRPETVLFLDGFDEDELAIRDHRTRLDEIIRSSAHFRTILITCRTQSFAREEELPTEPRMRIPKAGPTRLNETKFHIFHKVYLSPFSIDEIEAYWRRRFPFWRRQARVKARAIVANCG